MGSSYIDSNKLPLESLRYLWDLLGNNAAAVDEILTEMKLQWQDDREELETAIKAADCKGVKRVLHQMKSTFSPLGPDHELYKTVRKKEALLIDCDALPPAAETEWPSFFETINGSLEQLQVQGE